MTYQDLLKDTSAVAPDDNNKFIVTITDLEVSTVYPTQFRWKYKDGTFGKWSVVRALQTPGESTPATPSALTAVGGAGFITVTWDGKDSSGSALTNFKQLDIYIDGAPFDGTKPTSTLFAAGTKTIAAAPGIYILTAKAASAIGTDSLFALSTTVTVTAIGEIIEPPTNPNGFTASRVLAGIQLNWAGTYANGKFTGFEAIKVYAGTSATATAGTYTEVGVLTGNNVKNTITIPVDGTYVKYGEATYLHAAAVNKSEVVGTLQANVANVLLGPGKATDADINDGAVVIEKLASDVLTVGNLKAGDINATSYIRAGTKAATGTGGIVAGGRVEISSASITQPGANVLPGLYIYNSAGNPVLSAPLGGGLTINGNGTFSGNLSAAGGTFSGALSAATGSFSGTITATAGAIGGWILGDTYLQNTAGTFQIDSDNSRIALGATNANHIRINTDGIATYNSSGQTTNKFNLNKDGTLLLSATLTASDIYVGTNTSSTDYIKSDGAFSLGKGAISTTAGGGNTRATPLLVNTPYVRFTSAQQGVLDSDDNSYGGDSYLVLNTSGELTKGRALHYGGTTPPTYINTGGGSTSSTGANFSARSGNPGRYVFNTLDNSYDWVDFNAGDIYLTVD